ncbi:MAG: hypothetical protein ACOZCO_03475 [Bacteroidota bacterium]
MKNIFSLFFIFSLLISACHPKAGPVIRSYKKDGVQWEVMKIYGYPSGKRKLSKVNVYKDGWLWESDIYYELWPNNEWKLVSKNGFTVIKEGKYLLNNDSIVVPDNIIYRSFDKNHREKLEVYQNGKRIPYTLGYYDGYESSQFLIDKPGVYRWENGVEYFVREFTPEEWEQHRRMNEYLNNNHVPDTSSR